MAEPEKGRSRRKALTRLVEDLVDDTRGLVDDVVDRARDVGRDTRKAVLGALDRDQMAEEMDSLRSALDDLTAKINRLAALQGQVRKPSPKRPS